MRDFCSRTRVLSRVSKVERCCLTAFPLARSAFVAADMAAMTDFWDSAIIRRKVTRSFEGAGVTSGELLEPVLTSLPPSEKSLNFSDTESPQSGPDDPSSSASQSSPLEMFMMGLIFSFCPGSLSKEQSLSSPLPMSTSPRDWSSIASLSVSSSSSIPSPSTAPPRGTNSYSSEGVPSLVLSCTESLSSLGTRSFRLTREP